MTQLTLHERCREILNEEVEGDVEERINQLRSLRTENEISEVEYNYILAHWDELLYRYYISAIGYNTADEVTDYEQDFGDFDTYEEAYCEFVKLQGRNPSDICEDIPDDIWYIKLQLEEYTEDEECIECVDVRNETDLYCQ